MPSKNVSLPSGDPELTVVIPALNEERCLGKNLEGIISYLRGRKKGSGWEIIVVDDGSSDRTQEAALSFHAEGVRVMRNPVNMGKGYSVKRGVFRAKGAYVVFMDADLSNRIEEMDRILQPLRDGYDVAIASRTHPHSRIVKKQPLLRALLGGIFIRLVHRLNLSRFSDTQCGFKAFRRDSARHLFKALRTDGFAFDVEVLLLARKYGMKVAEVPVTWRDSDHSTISIISPRTVRMLSDIFFLRWRYRRSL